MAIGGAIGTGLFLGAGKTIQLTGPSILLAYIITGIILFLIMRALGELLLSNLQYHSFVDFVRDYLGNMAAFITGWTYWFCWISIAMADITAVGMYTQFWFPDVPQWMPGLIALVILLIMNLATVKLFGEMEFWFASSEVDVHRLDTLVRQHTHHGATRAAAEGGRLNGLFKGFIDLCFEHNGRYYVADYKSNWLGPDDSSYSPLAMEAAILEHRYDLQYVLYLLALHRQLKARLPGYDYDQHIGGALFIFLRGLSAHTRGVYFTRPPRALIEQLDLLFQGRLESAGPGEQADLFLGASV